MKIILFILVVLYIVFLFFKKATLCVENGYMEYRVYRWWGKRLRYRVSIPVSPLTQLNIRMLNYLSTWRGREVAYFIEADTGQQVIRIASIFFFRYKNAVAFQKAFRTALEEKKSFNYASHPEWALCIFGAGVCLFFALILMMKK